MRISSSSNEAGSIPSFAVASLAPTGMRTPSEGLTSLSRRIANFAPPAFSIHICKSRAATRADDDGLSAVTITDCVSPSRTRVRGDCAANNCSAVPITSAAIAKIFLTVTLHSWGFAFGTPHPPLPDVVRLKSMGIGQGLCS